MKHLAQKLIDAKRKTATEMVGIKIETFIKRKAMSIDSDKGTATFIMSTCNMDRHGEIVDQDSWMLNYFLENPIFFLNHNSDQFPIGQWLSAELVPDPANAGKQMLIGTAEFRIEFEDAARAFIHVQKGDMRAVSVGFIPHRVEYDENTDSFVLYDCELLECSLVGLPSNRQALIKTVDDETAREAAIDAQKILDKEIKESDTIPEHKKRAFEFLSKAIRTLG